MQPTTTPKKPRATRQNYGIKKDAIIHLADKASRIKYRGNILDHYQKYMEIHANAWNTWIY